ncbi:MAG: polyketide cyclase [Gammaproteobacteria bacterium RBG_16_66_13]|nr:MAG: polyketide cyclase [Gammaproteobacteria bacterium RBG_16_66_13]
MSTPKNPRTPFPVVLSAAAGALLIACAAPANDARSASADELCATRLAIFDTLDYDVFTNQKWDRLAESDANDIVVSGPDGHDTNGIDKHIEDLKAMFVYAPNTSIQEHPIRICSGDHTAVMGIMTGTFSQPMPTPDGQTIPPTGKSFRLPMTTIGLWRGSTMIHEWLFWDNQSYMRQIGLAP